MFWKRHNETRRLGAREQGNPHAGRRPGRRRLCVEPVESRLLLSAVADVYSTDGGFIDLSDAFPGDVTTHGGLGDVGGTATFCPAEGPEGDGADSPAPGASGSPVPAHHAPDTEPTPVEPDGPAGTDSPATQCTDAVLLRLEPKESSSASSGEGLIDVTRVLSEPAPLIDSQLATSINSEPPVSVGSRVASSIDDGPAPSIDSQLAPSIDSELAVSVESQPASSVSRQQAPSADRKPDGWENWGVWVASGADRAGSSARGVDAATTGESSLDREGRGPATSPGPRAEHGSRPFAARPGGLRGSPYGAIEGSRGVSQAFEVAASPQQGSIGDGPPGDAGHGLPSAPTLDRSVWSPHQPSPLQASPHSLEMARSADLLTTTSAKAPDGVVDRTPAPALCHDVVLAELAGPAGDAFFHAVYLDGNRPIDVIPLLAVAAVAQQAATERSRAEETDRTRPAQPPRRRPSGG